jgi:hypothetical protein
MQEPMNHDHPPTPDRSDGPHTHPIAALNLSLVSSENGMLTVVEDGIDIQLENRRLSHSAALYCEVEEISPDDIGRDQIASVAPVC